ncbi:hypothetical protein GCM10020331_001080 [Ectobacillus funiculus]
MDHWPVIHSLLFLNTAADNIRDLGWGGVTAFIDIDKKTPLLAINILFVLAICYVLYLGIEVLGRTAEVFIVILFLFGVAGNFF